MSNLKFNWNGKIREYNTIQEFLRDTAIFSSSPVADCNFDAGFRVSPSIRNLPDDLYIDFYDEFATIGVRVKPMLEFFAKAAPEMLIEALKKENAL